MAQYPLTPDGVKAKQDELYKLDDKELINQAVTISRDGRAWVIENFKLSEEQNEYYKSFPDDFNCFLSWQMASAVIGRQYFTIGAIPEETSKASNSRKKTSFSASGSVSYNPQTGTPTYGMQLGVTFTL